MGGLTLTPTPYPNPNPTPHPSPSPLKTLVDMSKAMDNHHYKFDGTFGPASSNAQIFEHGLRPMVLHP